VVLFTLFAFAFAISTMVAIYDLHLPCIHALENIITAITIVSSSTMTTLGWEENQHMALSFVSGPVST
jgi:hypothetical protein